MHVYILLCIMTEAIQSRCAMLRYSRLSDAQILERLLQVCDKEKVCRTLIDANQHLIERMWRLFR